MATYLVIYEHRHGSDLIQFETETPWRNLRDLISADAATFTQIIGIGEYEPEIGETVDLYDLSTFDVPKIPAEKFIAALTKMKLMG